MSNTRNKNRRRRRRNGMNIFWLMLSTDKGCNRPILFSREPHQHPETTYREWYDGWKWNGREYTEDETFKLVKNYFEIWNVR